MPKTIDPPELDALEGVDNWQLWLGNNVTTLSDKDLATLEAWLATQSSSVMGSDFPAKLVAAKEGSAKRAKKAVTEAVQAGEQPPDDLNDDGVVSTAERTAKNELPATVKEETKKAATAQGATPEQAEQAGATAESEILGLISGEAAVPPIIAQYTGYTPSGRPTPEQTKALIDAWNTLNPMAPVTNENELFERMSQGGNQGGPIQQQVAEIAFLGAEPLIDYRISTIDGNTFTVPAATFEILNRDLGYTTAEMTSAVRAAARANLTDGRGDPAWQVLLGLANATKNRNALTPLDDPSRQSVEDARRELQREIDAARYTGRAQETDGGTITSGGYTAKVKPIKNPLGPNPVDEDKKALDEATANANAAGVATASINYTSGQNLQQLGVQFDAGRKLYGGDDMLGLLHVVDASLAAKVAVTDPSKISMDDRRKISEIYHDMGLTDDQLAALGYSWISDFASGKTADSGGTTRQQPDPVALRQAARDLYRALYVDEPSEAQLDQLAASVTSAIASAPDDQSIDPNARLRQAAEGLPEYRELYGQKPEGQTEAEYRSQFDASAGSILGTTAADPSVIQGGMRTGRTQTSVGAAAASKGAWESSTFLGRLAAAAQIVSQNS